MLLSLLFLFLFAFCTAMETQVQMTVFPGKVMNSASCEQALETVVSAKECLTSCGKKQSCQACLFRLTQETLLCRHCNQTVQAETFDVNYGKYIGLKSYSNTTSPEKLCPNYLSSTSSKSTSKTSASTIKLTSATKFLSTPKPPSTTTKKPTTAQKKTTSVTTTTMKTTTRRLTCPTEWFLSTRNSKTWCLLMNISSDTPLKRNDAKSFCINNKAIISGLKTQKEVEFVRNITRKELLNDKSLYSAENQGWGVWVDGERLNGKQSFSFLDFPLHESNGAEWCLGQPDGFARTPQQNCIQMMVSRSLSDFRHGMLDDIDCNDVQGYGMVMKAVVCGKAAT